MTWEAVVDAVDTAKSIAWDGCHKIYVLMDDAQTAQMESYGYHEDDSELLLVSNLGKYRTLETLREWWDCSCGLRFISAVRTVPGDPNEGFTDLISQTENGID
jgi:hypothetical protein